MYAATMLEIKKERKNNMNQKEKELFLELCKFRNPNKETIASLLKSGVATPEVLDCCSQTEWVELPIKF